MNRFLTPLLIAFATVVCPMSASAQIIFADNFDSGASLTWQNNVGSWSAVGGVYNATAPSSFPNAHSALPFALSDFAVDVDVNSVADGGIWLRSAAAPGSPILRQGVLLVTGAGTTGGTGLYWHVVSNGTTYGSPLNGASGLFGAGSNPHIRVEVVGDVYSAFVNGSLTPATTLNTSLFNIGEVALYDFSVQTFDNFAITVVPEPSSLLLASLAIIGGGSRMFRHRRALGRRN